MRRSTVKHGLELVVVGQVLVALAAFFPDRTADLLGLSASGEVRFIFLCFFIGGVCGGFGLLVALVGILRGETAVSRVRLKPVLVAMAILVLVLLLLYLLSPRTRELPRLRPGETITI